MKLNKGLAAYTHRKKLGLVRGPLVSGKHMVPKFAKDLPSYQKKGGK